VNKVLEPDNQAHAFDGISPPKDATSKHKESKRTTPGKTNKKTPYAHKHDSQRKH
jgi:hypothetical protein